MKIKIKNHAKMHCPQYVYVKCFGYKNYVICNTAKNRKWKEQIKIKFFLKIIQLWKELHNEM
jgi:hypothetical protein